MCIHTGAHERREAVRRSVQQAYVNRNSIVLESVEDFWVHIWQKHHTVK